MTYVPGIVLALAVGAVGAGSTPPATGRVAALEGAIVRLERAEATYDRTAIEAVVADLSELQRQDPKNAAYAYHLGRAYLPLINIYDYAGDARKAEEVGQRGLECARAAVALDPTGNPDAYRLLGDFYGRLTSFVGVFARMRYGGESAKHHKAALEKDPQSIRAVIGVGTDKLLAPASFGGDVAAAVALFQRAVEMDPASAAAPVWLAKAYLKQKKLDLARQAFAHALAAHPESGFVRAEFKIFQREVH